MKKLLYIALLVGSYAAFIFYIQLNATSSVSTTPVFINDAPKYIPPTAVPVITTLPTPSPAPAPAPAPKPTPAKQAALYKNGSYTGISADAYYGNVQVRITVSNGAISGVEFLDHPQDRGRSIQINNYAMPRLISEVIQAQNTNINAISGATATSSAFMQSLQSAVSQATI